MQRRGITKASFRDSYLESVTSCLCSKYYAPTLTAGLTELHRGHATLFDSQGCHPKVFLRFFSPSFINRTYYRLNTGTKQRGFKLTRYPGDLEILNQNKSVFRGEIETSFRVRPELDFQVNKAFPRKAV